MFELVQNPIALPGACYFCGSGDKSPYIDWGVSIEFYGALYTCHQCTESVAMLLGMLSERAAEALKEQNDRLITANHRLEVKNEALREAIENLVVANEPVVSSNDQSSNSVVDSVSTLLADDQADSEGSSSSTELLDSGERTSDESSDDEGVDELHSDEPEPFYKLKI